MKMNLNGKRRVFVTSDSHFSHKNISKFCPDTRRGADAAEMDELMIAEWNKVVHRDDIVFHLGDFAFGDPNRHKGILERLKGEIHLVLGNHDNEDRMAELGFAGIYDMLKLVTPWGKFHLCHYPMEDWDRNYLHLHGHTHGNLEWSGVRFDVGIDARKDDLMAPWELREVARMMREMRNAGNLGSTSGAERVAGRADR